MILSAQSIRARGIMSPFSERTKHNGMSFGLSAAGYDVRLSLENTLSFRNQLFLSPGQSILAATLERFEMPNDLLAVVHDKSTWARQGLAVQNTVIEPGWCGYLTLELSNHSDLTLTLRHGDPIAQIIFHMLDMPSDQPYSGKYQNQAEGPQAARFE
jgi:dCTP deaminase